MPQPHSAHSMPEKLNSVPMKPVRLPVWQDPNKVDVEKKSSKGKKDLVKK